MARSLVAPWASEWWPEIVKCAEKGGHTAAEIIEEVSAGKAVGWPVDDGFLLLARTHDDALLIWIGVGKGVRDWCGKAEEQVGAFAKSVGCHKLRIEGRKGWQRVLPHWTRVGDDLELPLS